MSWFGGDSKIPLSRVSSELRVQLTEKDKKQISLLEYALDRTRVNKDSYFFCAKGQRREEESIVYLVVRVDDVWCFYIRHGNRLEIAAQFYSASELCEYIFWKACSKNPKKDTQYAYEEDWARRTGLSFSASDYR